MMVSERLKRKKFKIKSLLYISYKPTTPFENDVAKRSFRCSRIHALPNRPRCGGGVHFRVRIRLAKEVRFRRKNTILLTGQSLVKAGVHTSSLFILLMLAFFSA